MKLSILIVNHNLCERLKGAVNSLTNAVKSIDYQFIVVDNGSTDGSVTMLSNEFPQVHVIRNDKRQSLSKATNQALRLAKGEYVLMVSPDTITNKDSLDKTLAFMDQHINAAALSVRLITPMGRFIKESKHGVAKPWITFFKLTGLYKFFPKSHLFDHKPADWTEEFETSEIDVLNGSCMLLRRSVLSKIGLFDERFANYGHDIDLSYRIKLSGYKNYYFGNTYLIRFQQPEINKLSWDYLSQYYGAMFIFAGKYLFKMPVINIQNMGEMIPSSYEVER